MIIGACSTKKNTFVNRTYQGFITHYNAIFNSKEIMKKETDENNKKHQDDFHSGYIDIFKINSLIELAQRNEHSEKVSKFFGVELSTPSVISSFNNIETKALKIIDEHSMVFKGEERNKEIFNVYILLAEARLYQGKLNEALEAVNEIHLKMPNDKRLPLAKIYEALIYHKLGNNVRADEILSALDRKPSLKKEYRKLLSVYYAQVLLHTHRKEAAVEQLDTAMKLNTKREIRSRIAYLRGQILSELNRKEEARESFVAAYRYANNFEFEVKTQVEIAKTFDTGDNYDEAKKYLENISKKGTYASRKNEFYYALGLMADKAGKEAEAQEFLQKSIKEKASDPHIRGLTYFELGKSYFKKEDYIRSGAYYDSALAVMTHPATKEKVAELSTNIKNVAKNFYLVKKNDSILALTKMSDNERTAFFQKHINELKEKESKINAEKEKERKNKGFENHFDTSTFSTMAEFSSKKSGKFYFSSQEAMAKGSLEFKKIWGNRSLGDNWRFSRNKTSSLDDVEKEALGRDKTADARRFEVAYYTEKIPTDKEEILNLKKDRDTASLGLGRMYEAYFQNTKLATKTLYDLVDNQPEDEVKLQALYSIFSMNFEKNPSAADRAKAMILSDFPYTPYAEFVKNPRRAQFTQSEESVKAIYQKAYAFFVEEKFEDAKAVIKEAIEQYPKDALIPKFELLNAVITGKTVGRDIMILQLQQIVFNYEKTEEGMKAKALLDYLGEKKDPLPSPILPKNKENDQDRIEIKEDWGNELGGLEE